MSNTTMNDFNMPRGAFNKDIRGIIDACYEKTVEGAVVWAETGQPSVAENDLSYTTSFGDFTIVIGQKSEHPTLLITDHLIDAVTVRVDAEYPPDLSVRAKLAGDVFGLVMLVSEK